MKYSNEKEFDSTLDKIGELYELGKQAIMQTAWGITATERLDRNDIAFKNLQELRDIACHLLKRNHEQNSN